MTKNREHIGRKIDAYLKDYKVSQTRLASRLGLSQQTISYIVQKGDLPVYTVRDIAEELNIPAYEILLTKEEVADIKGIHPNLQGVLDDLSDIAYNKELIDVIRAVIQTYKNQKG